VCMTTNRLLTDEVRIWGFHHNSVSKRQTKVCAYIYSIVQKSEAALVKLVIFFFKFENK